MLDADYRKGPKEPFPAAVHDAEDVLHWVRDNPQRFDQQRIFLSGFSAGAKLALVISSLSAAEESERENSARVRAVVSFYPPTDLSIDPEDRRPPNPKYSTPTAFQRFSSACYIPPSVDKTDPRLSPLYANPTLFPQDVVIITCDGDFLCLEGEELAHKLDVGSRSVVHTRVLDAGHGFDKTCKPGSREEKLRDEIYAMVAKTLRGD